jgi:hypothetical protein
MFCNPLHALISWRHEVKKFPLFSLRPLRLLFLDTPYGNRDKTISPSEKMCFPGSPITAALPDSLFMQFFQEFLIRQGVLWISPVTTLFKVIPSDRTAIFTSYPAGAGRAGQRGIQGRSGHQYRR